MTTVTRLTSTAPAAIAVLEVRGPNAEASLGTHWVPHRGSSSIAMNTIRYGRWNSPSSTAFESVVVCKTEETTFEIHCHGGRVAADRILQDLIRSGVAIQVEASSRTRAERLQRQAIEDLASAKTQTIAAILLDQYRGALEHALTQITDRCRAQSSMEALQQTDSLIAWRSLGLHLTKPFRVVLVGAPNVGKSSLINRWLGYDRSIVHAMPGTTRDVLVEPISMGGWMIDIMDTAGLRSTVDPLEREGMHRALQAIETADLLLELRAPDVDEIPPLSIATPPRLIVYTKSDIERASPNSFSDSNSVHISARTGDGMQELQERILSMLLVQQAHPGAAIPFREEHYVMLNRARNAICSQDWNQAIKVLEQVGCASQGP